MRSPFSHRRSHISLNDDFFIKRSDVIAIGEWCPKLDVHYLECKCTHYYTLNKHVYKYLMTSYHIALL